MEPGRTIHGKEMLNVTSNGPSISLTTTDHNVCWNKTKNGRTRSLLICFGMHVNKVLLSGLWWPGPPASFRNEIVPKITLLRVIRVLFFHVLTVYERQWSDVRFALATLACISI